MLSKKEMESARNKALLFFEKAGIVLTPEEKNSIEVADFGLGDLYKMGLQVLIYINTERVCAKELVMFPGQTCPEHLHPSKNGIAGKEETFRCRWGKVHLYVEGKKNSEPLLQGLENYSRYLAVAKEIVLYPGQQYTIVPDTLHWFRAGEEGAVVSEFSTTSTDDQDIFTDPQINRFTVVTE